MPAPEAVRISAGLHAGNLYDVGVSVLQWRELVDEFGVPCGKRDGVVSGLQGCRHVPDERTIRTDGRAEYEIGTRRDWHGQDDFPGTVEGAFAYVVRVHRSCVTRAALGRKAVG